MQPVFAPSLLQGARLQLVPVAVALVIALLLRALSGHMRVRMVGGSRACAQIGAQADTPARSGQAAAHMRSAQCFILIEADCTFRGLSDRNCR